mmetsp:Transcript_39064/g.71822  ORF Transcript_39064/g.71822 Transcript_39064/m.71822 type:complete len:131 (-) Transcript_39064:2-394(-)
MLSPMEVALCANGGATAEGGGGPFGGGPPGGPGGGVGRLLLPGVRWVCKRTSSSSSSSLAKRSSSSLPDNERLLFPGTWGETSGGGTSSPACKYTDFFPFAVRGDRLLPADHSRPKSGGGGGGGGGVSNI